MITSSALLADLKTQLRVLQADLKERADDATTEWGAALQREHAEALRRERTGLSWTAWRDNEVDQAAVAWIVATTFIRFCEDNDLLAGATLDGMPVPVGWIAGPGDRTARARENQTAYFRVHTSHHDRDWLQQAFRVLAAQPAGAALVDPKHNSVWTAEISAEAAKGLVSFWRRTHDDGTLVHDFTDPDLDTRFLGDLYQDLSDHAKKTYALLQTPEFVEEFILDRTLTPAIAEFGIEGLKLIDPTCGSGHFLLGAFERLNDQWASEAPGLDPKQRVRKAMDSIHGVDLNPFAVAIARFRLTVAGIRAAGETSLVGVPPLGFHLAIGDSLLGEQGGGVGLFDDNETFSYDSEDLGEYAGILKPGQYHVVVGNPPYITVKDKVLNQIYRKAYSTAAGTYSLSVPFVELFFRLAVRGEIGRNAGYVAQITSNSFMKRGFGKKLIEELFAGYHESNPVDLTQVIDTSGAYIPGHGTPTVILVGRRRRRVAKTVRAALSVRGEPGQPADPANGLVWREIVNHVDNPGYEGNYTSITDLASDVLAQHPWSLTGGGSADVLGAIETGPRRLIDLIEPGIGRAVRIGADDAFVRYPCNARAERAPEHLKGFLEGEDVRDYRAPTRLLAYYPYVEGVATPGRLPEALWPYRTTLAVRATFQGMMADAGRQWWEYMQHTASAYTTPLSIVFSHVATQNHFALDRGGSVFSRHAPVIKLPEGATEEQHLELLGVLNSSTACFWLKQVSHNKGEGGGARVDAGYAAMGAEEWRNTYEFTGTKLQEFPLPAQLPGSRGAALDSLAQALGAATPEAVVAQWTSGATGRDLADVLSAARAEWGARRRRLVFEQEELDWETYRLYGLLDEDLTYQGESIDQIELGQRAFEIALARKVKAGEEETAWFDRHGSTPICDLPAEWPADYRKLVEKRLEVMASERSIRLLERPEYKRRWATLPWERQLKDALESAILDRLEEPTLWRDHQGPAARSVAQLADLLRADHVLLELARALTDNPEPDLAAIIESLAPTEAVPYLAAYRYKPSGLEKYREWQAVWGLQRREDAGEKVTIPVPPKYKGSSPSDFQKDEYWKARGKLDVPKERFVLYPGVGREGDTSPVLGWAGWNHRDQAVALVREILAQQALGASDDSLVPMVAGLVELEPWLHQWHTDLEPEFGSSAAQAVTSQIDQLLAQLQTTRDEVNAWRPPAARRGRRRA